MRPLQKQWTEEGLGFQLGSDRRHVLTNLRFADDILLVAQGQKQMKRMMGDLMRVASVVGLQIHPKKQRFS
eukprot:3932925-Karenia_brevis.AAC.1